MPKYEMIIYWSEEDQAFVAGVPELPGCAADGHRAEQGSYEDARKSIEVASAILETLFPAVATQLGLHIHEGFRLCNQWRCRLGLEQSPASAGQ